MATMILSAAGSSLGSAAGGSLLGLGAATIGRAFGGVAGSLLDQQLLGRGASATPAGRMDRIRIQSAGEGDAIARVFGRMRVSGQVIWTSRFKEHVDETREGGKGSGARSSSYRYSVSFAVALCEGSISRIGRVWADGVEISLSDLPHRVHRGGEMQLPDPLIEAIQGDAPAFRGIAYIVFEDLDLAPFGNRAPQLNFEVWREPAATATSSDAPRLSTLVRAVAMSPGSGEFSLDTLKVRRITGPGQTEYENVNTGADRPDILVSLSQLSAEAPNCEAVSLVVSWFGDDLRCGTCEIAPCVEKSDKETSPATWSVSGVGRGSARLVSHDDDGRPIFGGTPSDGSVVRAIQRLAAEGRKVMFYPFILMDIPATNTKIDPWTGQVGQPAFPWRGRITLDRAPGVAGSTDKTIVAAQEVRSFFGDASSGDFTVNGETVSYSGPAEWSFRRFILHYAHLCAAAGGVDSFCIGSEMRSLTQIRGGPASYPSVGELVALAEEVRTVLGPSVKIGYAADWSEYFGHQPGDGSGDVFHHLDPLWASPEIDFIGIDNYFPLSDWRHEEAHLDEDKGSVYSLNYLRGNVEGGEGYDWFYADQLARERQERSLIDDTAHGEHWIFRPKDIRNWWSSAHHDRPGGARSATPTAWIPQSKPIWFTEIGCPAVDLGANQPNVFFDPKSSESFLPHFSRGVRDDFMQRRYLEAALSYWVDPATNPLSAVYGGRMIDNDRVFVWTWDARPFPDFPMRTSVWSDGPNHRLGHWVTGRLGATTLGDVVAEICRRSGVPHFDVSELHGVVQGYMVDEAGSGRAALQPLMIAFDFDAVESGEALRFRHRSRPVDAVIATDALLASERGGEERSHSRSSDGDLSAAISCRFVDLEREYEIGSAEARHVGSSSTRSETMEMPVALDEGAARDIVDRALRDTRAGREGVNAGLAPRLLSLEVGDIVGFSDHADGRRFRIDALEDEAGRRLTLSRIPTREPAPSQRFVSPPDAPLLFPAGPIASRFLDLPLVAGAEAGLRIAAFSSPWVGAAAVFVDEGEDEFVLVARVPRPSVVGRLENPLASGSAHGWSRGDGCLVRLFGGGLSSKSDTAILNGANLAAVRTPSGEWELIQFQSAQLVGTDLWRLQRLLRGRFGTEPFIGDPTPAGSDFVLIDGADTEIAFPASLRGTLQRFRVGPARKPFTHESYTEVAAMDRGIRLRPYSPVHLRARRLLPSGDVGLSWIRRSRTGGDSWNEPDAPLGEARERYLVRLGALREVETTAPEFHWSAMQQAEDGAFGSVEISVSQISEQFGAGPAAKVIINV